MGSIGSGTCPPLAVLALHLLLLLSPCLGWIDGRPPGKIHANFAHRIQKNEFISTRRSRNLTFPWNLPPDALTVSTVWLDDKPCVQINVSINVSGLPKLHGFNIQLSQPARNWFDSFSVKKRECAKVGNLLKCQWRRCDVEPGLEVLVTLQTIPDYKINLTKEISIPDSQEKSELPSFHYEIFEEEKVIVVSMSESQTASARLCYKYQLCEELDNSNGNKTQFDSSGKVSLPYDVLVPCLCIEVFYKFHARKKMCPFEEHPESYYLNMMKMSAQEIIFNKNKMMVKYRTPCRIMPTVSLCKMLNGSCVAISDTMTEEGDHGFWYYSVSDTDRDPKLCFQFSLTNKTHYMCPNDSHLAWKVDVTLNLFHVLLQISSTLDSKSSFSMAICYQNLSTGTCATQSEVYNVSMPSGNVSKEVQLPWPGLGRCIKVWRTDVRFANEHVICSFDYSHKHLGLIALAMMLVTFTLTLLIFLIIRRIWKIFTAPLWRRTILLVYCPDSMEYKTLICAFADFLQCILGCEVILDMWDMNNISKIGMIPWFYQKRELVSQRKGKVMIMWTTRTKAIYQQWRDGQLNSFVWKDPGNLFGVAMSCLNKDLVAEHETEKLKEYAIVYFEGLCEKKDIPKALRKVSRYRLFKHLYRLVSQLQDTTCLSPPCLIKAVAKYLMKKLIRSEQSQGLQWHVEICKQRLHQGMGVEKIKMETTAF